MLRFIGRISPQSPDAVMWANRSDCTMITSIVHALLAFAWDYIDLVRFDDYHWFCSDDP
jgi:hypothetical protein